MGKKKRADSQPEDAVLDKAARKALKALAKERRSAAEGERDLAAAVEAGKPTKADKPAKAGKKPKAGKKLEDARPAAAPSPVLDDDEPRNTTPGNATTKARGDAKPGEKAEKKKARDKKSPPAAGLAATAFAVDVVVVALAVRDRQLLVAASPTLPATALRPGEPLVAAAARALGEAGLRAGDATLLPLATDVAGRDRLQVGWVALCAPDALDDGAWLPAAETEGRDLVEAAVERVGTLLETTTIATAMVPAEFTVGELRAVYEAVWGVEPDGRNFHRKVTGATDFLVETGERTTRGGGRPAMVHRAGPARRLNPALTRP